MERLVCMRNTVQAIAVITKADVKWLSLYMLTFATEAVFYERWKAFAVVTQALLVIGTLAVRFA